MNKSQLEAAQRRTKELLDYENENQKIRDFIQRIEDEKYVYLTTTHQHEMWSDARKTYEFIGEDLIDLLKTKLWEREDYLEKIQTDDLIRE